ncbi:serine hydrolase [Ramlibacter sp. WS9]|uniref:serine hydrolase domain-containing protein n=1 Tax=Ramlibacter sp. WS9 TaxID=1882741 RepID=UPI0011437B3A|nr:class A beta-lactamase-related serine hydrolase [Ramlibacter sp. WS9]
MARLNRSALARLRATLQSHIDRQRIPGAIAVVALGGHVELFEALGRQDPQTGAPMKDDAIFRIYSMTKPIVSLATLILAEEGGLQLADPVSKYLPEFANQQVAVEEGGAVRLQPSRRDATVHDLLRHTAGLTYEFLGSNAVQRQYEAADITNRSRTSAEFCKVLAAMPLADQPGTCWQYSRATDVLGALIEVAAGQPLGALLQQRVLGPLGMKDTAFAVPQDQWHRTAEPFANDPDSGDAVVMMDGREVPKFESGGGGLLSTAADYTRFLQLMRNGGSLEGTRMVSRKTIEWMTADHLGAIPANGDLLLPGYGFGLGFSVRTHAGLAPQPGSVGQYFWSGIGGTSFFVDPAEDLFAMLLTQAPNQRIFFRNLFRHLVYAAVD